MDKRRYEWVSQVVNGLGYEFVHAEWVPRSGLMRVYIDKSTGIGVDDCAFVSEHLSRAMTVEGFGYERLEVSSPGLDRPLAKQADFARFHGRKARVVLRVALNGRKNFTGTIGDLSESGIQLIPEHGGAVTLSLANIEKARLVPDL